MGKKKKIKYNDRGLGIPGPPPQTNYKFIIRPEITNWVKNKWYNATEFIFSAWMLILYTLMIFLLGGYIVTLDGAVERPATKFEVSTNINFMILIYESIPEDRQDAAAKAAYIHYMNEEGLTCLIFRGTRDDLDNLYNYLYKIGE